MWTFHNDWELLSASCALGDPYLKSGQHGVLELPVGFPDGSTSCEVKPACRDGRLEHLPHALHPPGLRHPADRILHVLQPHTHSWNINTHWWKDAVLHYLLCEISVKVKEVRNEVHSEVQVSTHPRHYKVSTKARWQRMRTDRKVRTLTLGSTGAMTIRQVEGEETHTCNPSFLSGTDDRSSLYPTYHPNRRSSFRL